jgi:hypothetical protein
MANTNQILNLSGAPAGTWLLALMYVCLLINHLASSALGWKTPMQALTCLPQIFPSSFTFHSMNWSTAFHILTISTLHQT